MKTIYKIIMGMWFVGSFMVSCSDFLDEVPKNDLTEANAFTTYRDAEALINACYDGIQQSHDEYYTWYNTILSDCYADNAYAGGDDVDIINVGLNNVTPRNAVVMKAWKQLYGGILRANVALRNIPNIDDGKLEEEALPGVSVREEMLAEARALRALHYFNLVRSFGEVPLVTTTGSLAPEDVQLPRCKTVDEVYALIREDLDYAVERLPERRNTEAATRGLASKGMCNALYARLYAIMGAPHEVDWKMVKHYCDAVIESPVYGLVDRYEFLFDDSHRNNVETILAVQYKVNSTESNYVPLLLLPPSMTNETWRKYLIPSQDLLKAYEDAGDEVRKASTVVWEDINNLWFDEYYAVNNNGKWETREIPFAFKMRGINRVGWDCGDLIYMMRLADFVLLRAEAVNELEGAAAACADPLLQKIRERAGLVPFNTESKEEMRELLLKERRLELAYEGERFFDLKRHGKAVSVLGEKSWSAVVNGTRQNVSGHFSDYQLLFPIPQDERDRNPNLGQNPGYN